MDGRRRDVSPVRLRVGRPVSPGLDDKAPGYRGRQLESPPPVDWRDARARRHRLRSPSPPKDFSEREFIIRKDPGERLGLAFDDELTETKVTQVWPGPCESAGVKAGMVVTAIEGKSVVSLDSLQAAIATAGNVFTMIVEEYGLPVPMYPTSPAPLPTPPVDEVSQLHLQLEAANIQTRSAQTRMLLASEKEFTLQDELASELNKRLRAEADTNALAAKYHSQEEEIFRLKDELTRLRQGTTTTEQLNHERLRRAQIEEELLILRDENTSLKQLRLSAHPDRAARTREAELQAQLDEERLQSCEKQRVLEERIKDALARADEADVLRAEIQALTQSVAAGDPDGFYTRRSPVRRHIRDTPRRGNKYHAPTYPQGTTTTTTKVSEEYVRHSPGRERRSPRMHDTMLLSHRVREETTPVTQVHRVETPRTEPPKPDQDGLDDLDKRLNHIESNARDAIRAAERQAEEEQRKRAALEAKMAELEKAFGRANGEKQKVRDLEAENERLRREQEDRDREEEMRERDEAEKQRERATEREKWELEYERKRDEDEAKRRKEKEDRQRDREKNREREEQERAREEREREEKERLEREKRDKERQDREREREKERKERERDRREREEERERWEKEREEARRFEEEREERERKEKEDTRVEDMREHAKELFNAVCSQGGWGNVAQYNQLPKVLNCSEHWMTMFTDLAHEDNGVRLSNWMAWVEDINSKQGIEEAEKRMEWVASKIGHERSGSGGSAFSGPTTRERKALAKHVDMQQEKSKKVAPSNKYASWGNPTA